MNGTGGQFGRGEAIARPYHKYVFNGEQRTFVGDFEQMYQNEEAEGYDSWFQEDTRHLTRRIAREILNDYNFDRILDIGCGKGSFTHHLKKQNNHVIGTDISATAIKRAQARFPGIEFLVSSAESASMLAGDGVFDLVVMMEVLSYIPDWRALLRGMVPIARRIFITLYLPPEPIGFVKCFDDLRDEVRKSFQIETDVVVDSESVLLLCRGSCPAK